jgi:hypothetical protein
MYGGGKELGSVGPEFLVGSQLINVKRKRLIVQSQL